jgi:hypothetical protein
VSLEERLWGYTVDHLQQLVRVLGGPGPEGPRKEFLVRYIVERLTRPDLPAELWDSLDTLSQKAVAAAYYNGGEFNEEAFVAQYGARPRRRNHGYSHIYLHGYKRELLPLDLMLYQNRLPRELMPLLAPLVPPPEKFQIEGLLEAPEKVEVRGKRLPLLQADTERAGLHDLEAYLRLFQQGALQHSSTSSRLTPNSTRALLEHLLEGDFLPHEERVKFADTIRPFGLDIFVQTSGLLRNYRGRRLTDEGEALMLYQDAEALLHAFETWTSEGHFDELSRVTAIKGQKAKRTHLTPPAGRREEIVEALSWCPTGVWISVSDFLRALKIWHFDFELDLSDYSGLYVGNSTYGRLDEAGSKGWSLAKRLYVNAVLWEYLGSVGALDLLYLQAEDSEIDFEYAYEKHYSLYDRLAYFRINPLGAYLLGQAAEYVSPQPTDAPLFSIDPALVLMLNDPESLTPNLRNQLGQCAIEQDRGHYRLDTQQVLNALEAGSELQHIFDFLARRHEGPLPSQVTDWLEEIQANTCAFQSAGKALFIKAHSQALLQLVVEDPTLRKFVRTLEGRTLVIPASREKAFRERLKKLGYLLSQ